MTILMSSRQTLPVERHFLLMLSRAKTQRDLYYDYKTLLNTYYVLGEVRIPSSWKLSLCSLWKSVGKARLGGSHIYPRIWKADARRLMGIWSLGYSVTLCLKTKLRHPQDGYPSSGSLSLEDQKDCFSSDTFFEVLGGSSFSSLL